MTRRVSCQRLQVLLGDLYESHLKLFCPVLVLEINEVSAFTRGWLAPLRCKPRYILASVGMQSFVLVAAFDHDDAFVACL